MSKKLVMAALALAMAAGIASAQIKISMIYAGGDPLAKELISNSVAAFMKANPGVKVTEYPSPSGPYLDFIKVKDAVGEFPDLIEMRDTPMYVRAGKLAVLPAEVVDLVENPVQFDGKVYTVSLMAQAPLGMMYNAKFFRDNKLSEPKTYKEFTELCDKIKAKSVSPMVVGGKDIWHLGFLWSKYFFDEVTAKNPNWIADRYRGKVKWTDAEPRRGMQAFVDLFRSGYVDPGFLSTADNQTASILVSGKAAMLFSGTWMFQQIKDADPSFELGWFPLPSLDGKLNLFGGSTAQGWAISAEAAKDPVRLKACVDFIKFFFRKDNYVKFASAMSAIPSTVEEINYKAAPVLEKVLSVYGKVPSKQLMWNNKVSLNELPPAFRNFAYKTAAELLIGGSLDEGLKRLDAEWDLEAKSFNPVTGVGIPK